MSYLRCPECGLTLFDRNPLASPLNCPRCARRALAVELERVPQLRGHAAASVLTQPIEEAK
jgi:predicted Zn-ribbon and HTH transcriptional regulator